ncbi:hypothetical protein BA950_08370 [Erythrobacter sp. SAORIC-644]|uniref:AlbA family DNA-binding domain-containing protein n=1 Tax=Erythrobacter sp. SAORIC-644 TaxID=1869314 RepID=UPI000C9ED811|nr:ATP-binding protein [Erythrobacter sp. SAORIC-644]PNQ76465.1 hypothetical protein BA950_08370 [Erythrobacter sp. SAORIC-644]
MAVQSRIQELSEITRVFLESGETHEVDYKKVAKGLKSEDLVAFANADGGCILVGVVERTRNGVQIGEVEGCDVSDGTVLEILNKASSCIPPVALDVFIENLDQSPILRIAIPTSATKPHCTPKGFYLRREGTRNRALQPQEMLNLFLEIEAQSFAAKFEAAAEKITQDLTELETSLEATITNMGDQLGWAEYKLGDTEDTVDAILARVALVQRDAQDANARLRALFRQENRDDPVRERYKAELVNEILEQITGDPDILRAALRGDHLSGSLKGAQALELTEEDFQEAIQGAVTAIREEIERRKYTRVIKRPKECSDSEIDHFVELVSMGGEVVEGARARIMRARALGFLEYEHVPVGVAAIKSPLKSYKTKVFGAAGSEYSIDEFSHELGWIYLKENHRGKGLITPLIENMLKEVENTPVFATTRSSNIVMQQILKHFAFKRSGKPYRSVKSPDELIRLLLKIPEKKKEE